MNMRASITIDKNTLPSYLIGRICFTEIQTGIDRFRVLRSHFPEGILDDNGRIVTNSKLQKQDMLTLVLLQEIIVTLCSPVSALVLNELIITSEIHRHGLTEFRTFRYQLSRYLHILLKLDHVLDHFFVVVGLIVTRFTALEKSVVALGVKHSFFVKACLLKLVIDIRGDHEIILVLYKLEQRLVCAVVDAHVTVAPDKA